jgi:tRNA (mo5U34)-methyltransferase
MTDVAALGRHWATTALAPLAAALPAIMAQGLSAQRHGDLPRWRERVAALPALTVHTTHLDRDRITVVGEADSDGLARLEDALRGLHPWRKGPFELFGLHIDTEWRSDWKWQRLAPHIAPLAGRRVLDVGCGNGYHCWRMRGAGAAEVLGIDPAPLFFMQFQALQHYIRDPQVTLLPMTLEQLPPRLGAFDTVFSMGVLYHRRSPLQHLQALRDALRPGGQLVLETLVVEGDERQCLVPERRYARMGNVWFIPSSAMLLLWLRKLGWQSPRLVDECRTSTAEQRRTDWMQFHSLADFLDPGDPTRTLEGYPAPRRAVFVAEAPGA